ncbi:MAG: hypothetical protein QXV83_04380 [Candidatus Anstonellaceae archaeon]
MNFWRFVFFLFLSQLFLYSLSFAVCNNGEMQCDNNELKICINGNWVTQLSCGDLACVCSDSLNCDCIPTISCPGREMCSLSKKFALVCQNNIWSIKETCPQNNCHCVNNVCSCSQQQTCTPFSIRCKVEGTNQIQICSADGSTWLDSFCPNAGEICKGDVCQLICNDGEFRCSDDFESVLRCENQNWVEYDDCVGSGLVCDPATISCNCPPNSPTSSNPICGGPDYLIYCLPAYTIGERGEWFRETCNLGICQNGRCICNVGSKYCKDDEWIYVCNPNTGNFDLEKCPQGTICAQHDCVECFPDGISWCQGNTLYKCENKKVVSTPCPPETYCITITQDLAVCQSNNSLSCIAGDERCAGDVVETCDGVRWIGKISCAPSTTCSCTPEPNGLNKCSCVANVVDTSPAGSSGSSPSSSGSSSTSSTSSYSGGGEVKPRKCVGWSDWFVNKTEEKIDPTSPSVVCINTTYIRWCKDSRDNIDFSVYELKSDYKCAAKSSAQEICNYQSAGVYEEVEVLGTECRTCNRETLVYTCYPSGRQDLTNKKISSSCGMWRECTPEELQKYAKKPLSIEQPTSSSPSMLDIINKSFEQYGGILISILILFIVGFGVYLFWKFYSESKKPPKEGEV